MSANRFIIDTWLNLEANQGFRSSILNHQVNGLHISAVIPTKEIGGIPFMTLPLTLSNQNTKQGPGPCPYMPSLKSWQKSIHKQIYLCKLISPRDQNSHTWDRYLEHIQSLGSIHATIYKHQA